MKKEKKVNKIIFENENKKYYYSDILESITKVGVNKGDTIFVHSDLKSFGKINRSITKDEFVDSFIFALKDSVGDNGNIIMPTFSYSFCKDEVFDPEKTPSTVGLITEHFRKMEDSYRSLDPIFSVSVFGPNKDYFLDVGFDCFGKNSIFDKIFEKNCKILFLGETFDITFMHYVEQKFNVPYRYIKPFKGEILVNGDLKEFTFEYNVRPLDKNVNYDLNKIAEYLTNCKILEESKLGYSKIRMVSAKNAYDAINNGLKKDIYLLLKDHPTIQ